ncbi:hypothetical protein EV424DRAFT_1345503 [Suillus variegatus]|nr:hypothetical protein EV424DRAFT_1345503 [Suillus variegatus]
MFTAKKAGHHHVLEALRRKQQGQCYPRRRQSVALALQMGSTVVAKPLELVVHNVFSHCKTKPGFHSTIILSPKKDTRDTSDRHCQIYHIINTTRVHPIRRQIQSEPHARVAIRT